MNIFKSKLTLVLIVSILLFQGTSIRVKDETQTHNQFISERNHQEFNQHLAGPADAATLTPSKNCVNALNKYIGFDGKNFVKGRVGFSMVCNSIKVSPKNNPQTIMTANCMKDGISYVKATLVLTTKQPQCP